jgi:hypothetical protein
MHPYYALASFLHKLYGIISQTTKFKLKLKLEIKILHLYYRLHKTWSPLRIDMLLRQYEQLCLGVLVHRGILFNDAVLVCSS